MLQVQNRRFEAVRTVIEDDKIIEGDTLATSNFTILNRNDNLGPSIRQNRFLCYSKSRST